MTNKKSTPLMIDMGKKIAFQRKVLGLSRGELAKKLEVTHQQLAKYETAKNRVSADSMAILADVFKVNITYFFDTSTRDTTSETNYKQVMTLNMCRNFRAIQDPELQEAIHILVKTASRVK